MFDLGHSGHRSSQARKDVCAHARACVGGRESPEKKKATSVPPCNTISAAPRASSGPSARRPAPFEFADSAKRRKKKPPFDGRVGRWARLEVNIWIADNKTLVGTCLFLDPLRPY